MRPTFSQFVRTSAAVLLSSTLFGCGGGGGGASGTAPPGQTQPPPATEVPLLLTSANAQAATVVAFSYGATALVMGRLAVDWTALADNSATLSFSRGCPGGGTVNAALADRDGDRHAGTGDQVTVTLAGCYLKELDDTMDGTVMITLTAPTASQQRAGVVKFSGFKVHASTPNQEIVGAVRFDYSASHLSKLVHVYSDTQPFGLTFSDDKKTVTDTVTMLDAQHETRLDTMRATTTMRFHTFSNLLGGSLEVTTATPWSAWFDTYPDAGELSVAGANNSKASVRIPASEPGSRVDVLLGGTTVDHYSLDGIGVLWTGAPWLPQVASADHYTIAFPSASSFRSLRQPDPAPFLPNGSLVWIYSRPLDPQSVTGATFIQTSGKNNTLFTPVPATVTIEGGLLTVRPSVQLVPGAGYELRVSGIGFSLRDTAGNTLGLPSFSGTVVQTISASLVATAPPVLLGTGAMLVLDASGSTANGAPVALTRWKQLSGPSLTFSDATAPRVTLSTAGTVNGITVVELEVANAAGEFDRKQISVTVAPDLANAHVITYRNGTGPVTIAGSIDPANPSGYVRQSQANSVLDVVLTPVRFLAGLSNGQTWQTGLKLTYGFGNTSGVTGGGWLGCGNSNTGNFSVLDYALDTSGNVARLAMDFDDTCGTTVTQGSIRYHSAIPVRQ